MKLEFKNHLKKYLNDDEIEKLENEMNKKAKNSIIVDEEKINIKEFENEYPLLKKHPFVKNAYIYDKDVYDFGKSLLFELGAFYILEPCSLMVNYFLKPTKDDLVLDCCAAPGGKTIHASFLMQNEGFILSNELSTSRALTLSSNVEKYGRKNILVTNNNILDFPSSFNNTFDKIILDAPCSGSGMFRKENKMEDDWTLQKVLTLSELQKKIIIKAYDMLKKDGLMLYSTCSFSYEEDEEVILHLLNNKNAQIIDIANNDMFFNSPLKGTIHLFPYLFDGEGHYLALIKKNDEVNTNFLKTYKEEKNITKFPLKEYFHTYKDTIYYSSFNYKIENLRILRNGLILGNIDKKLGFIPEHNIARLLDKNLTYISLNKEETISYIYGNSLKKNMPDGYYLLKYNNLPFALTKVSKGTLKNHYPKGLRKTIKDNI